jgi:subtilisin family serine protease
LSTAEISTGSQKSADDLIAKLKQDDEVYTCQPFYTLKDGLDMGVTDEILVRFLPGVTIEEQNRLHKKFKTKVIKTTKIYQKLVVPKEKDALEIANQYYETGLVEFAHPNFISYPKFNQVIPNDTYFGNQVACHNTGQTFTDGHSGTNDADIDAPEAWGITTGCNDIVIAVLDEGVTSNHPDLPNTRQIRLNGSNFGNGNANDPSPTGNDNHGNACAGVIAATMNNSEGIAGIAPNCRIMPIRIKDALPNSVAEAIEFAVDNGAHILSNSWGYLTSDQNTHPVIVTAINYAVTSNRVVVFAAGNTADHDNGDNGYVTFPANVNIPYVITVGASDRNDNQANYSPTSSLIDIVAPSNRSMPWQDIAGETYEMWSIDIPGNTGYNPYPAERVHPPATGEILPNAGTNNLAYTARFGGTSHACPVIAGVAALMLSVNPDLSNEDVFDLFTSYARNVGGFTYVNGRCNEMGNGRVDAFASVKVCLGYRHFRPFSHLYGRCVYNK